MSEDNVTNHPDKDKGNKSPKEAAFKKIMEGKKNGLNDQIKKQVETVLAAKAVYDTAVEKLVELEEEYKALDKAKLDF